MDVMHDSPKRATGIGPDERAYVFAVVRRILRDEDDANDATQEALLLAYRHRDQFRGESAYKTWLHRIAVMTALGLLRKQRRQRSRLSVPLDEPSVMAELADPRPSPETTVAAKELATRVERAMANLGAGYRNVFLMRVGDWRESEIAEALGISVANVKIRAHRARERLRAALAVQAEAAEPDAAATVAPIARPVSPASPRAPRARPDSRADTSATSRAS